MYPDCWARAALIRRCDGTPPAPPEKIEDSAGALVLSPGGSGGFSVSGSKDSSTCGCRSTRGTWS